MTLPALPADWVAPLLALLAAMFFGASGLITRLGLRHGDTRMGSLISIGATMAMFWLLAPFLLESFDGQADVLLHFVGLFALIGLLSPGISLFLAFEGLRRMGPTISGTLAATAPLFAAAGAVLLLDEHITGAIVLGTAGIVAGGMVLTWRGKSRRSWPLWAILLPLGAALLRGGSHMLAKLAYGYAAAPVAGVLIAFTTAFCAVTLAYQLGGMTVPLRMLPRALRGGASLFAVTGALNGLALFCQYTALSIGRVVVVSPVISTFPVFLFLFSLAFGVERMSWRLAVGVLLVVGGVIGVSTG